MTTLAEKIAAKCADRLEYTGGDRKKIVAEILAALHEHAAPVEWCAGDEVRCYKMKDGSFTCKIYIRSSFVTGSGLTVADACQQAQERAEGKQ